MGHIVQGAPSPGGEIEENVIYCGLGNKSAVNDFQFLYNDINFL